MAAAKSSINTTSTIANVANIIDSRSTNVKQVDLLMILKNTYYTIKKTEQIKKK